MVAFRIDEQGRWGGRLTSRPLPESDDAIAKLTDAERQGLALAWLGRSATERRVSESFRVIRDALRAVDGEGEAIRLAERAIDDELRHAEICRYVASRFHGSELAPPSELPLVVPRLASASPELRHTLHIVGQCSLNETTASAFLEVCSRQARGALVAAALRELISDEIDHARIGWLHLAGVAAEVRATVGRWLLPLARMNLKMWREAGRISGCSDAYSAHGVPDTDAIEGAIVGAVRDLILPGFAMLGIATGPTKAWLDAGAPTDDHPAASATAMPGCISVRVRTAP